MLKSLYEVEELLAKEVFKKKIVRRFLSCDSASINYILSREYMRYLEEENLAPLYDKNALETIPWEEINFNFIVQSFSDDSRRIPIYKE